MIQTPLTQNIGSGKTPPDLSQYQQNGGYEGLKKALTMSPMEVMDQVKAAGIDKLMVAAEEE